jgi:hypothetical protein
VSATHVGVTMEKAYSKPVPVNALKMRYIRRLVPYIPDERKNIYGEILA